MSVTDGSKWKYCVAFTILCLISVCSLAFALPSVKQSVLDTTVDEIELKQNEMRNTVVMVLVFNGHGSGTIIDTNETDTDGEFEYRVLTNAHVVASRFRTSLQNVNSLTGKIALNTVDVGCKIIVFDHSKKKWKRHKANILVENSVYDIAIVSFVSDQKLAVASIASRAMLEQIRVFDDVFTIGCQLNNVPSPTFGIVSHIITKDRGGEAWVIYMSTSQITPGSSGGGLFKKYDGHYYLIGVPFRLSTLYNSQLIPHMAHAISIVTAREFIDQSLVSMP